MWDLSPLLISATAPHCPLYGGSVLQLQPLDLKMHEESCRLPKIDDQAKRRERYETLRADRSTASSRSKSVPVKVGAKLIEHWWERPEFAEKFVCCDRDPACESCRQFNEHQLHLLKLRRKFPPIKHVLSDFAHRYAKLQRHEAKLPKEVKKDFFHGIQASDVTSYLRKPVPSYCSRDQEAPTEWFGLKCSDVTKILDSAARGPMPPSREYSFGIQPTDVTQHTRVVPLNSRPQTDDDETQAFFGRPKSDVTNFNILPRRIEDKKCREEELHPLGKPRLLHAPHTHRLSLHSREQTLLNSRVRLKSNSRTEKPMFCRHEPSCRSCHDYNQKLGTSPKSEFDRSCGYILSPSLKSAVCQLKESGLHQH